MAIVKSTSEPVILEEGDELETDAELAAFYGRKVVVLDFSLADDDTTEWIDLSRARSVIMLSDKVVIWIVSNDAGTMNRYLARTDTNSDEMPWAADTSLSEAGFIHGDVMPDRVKVNNASGATAVVQVRINQN